MERIIHRPTVKSIIIKPWQLLLYSPSFLFYQMFLVFWFWGRGLPHIFGCPSLLYHSLYISKNNFLQVLTDISHLIKLTVIPWDGIFQPLLNFPN